MVIYLTHQLKLHRLWGFGAKPRWVGYEGEALPLLSRARCERMLTAERGFGGKTVVYQVDNHKKE